MVKIFLEVKGHPCITPMSALPLQPHAVWMRRCREIPRNPWGPFHYIFADNIVWSIKQASIHMINSVLLMLGAVNSQHLDSVPPSITLYPPPAPSWSHHHTPANSSRRTSRCRSEPSPCVGGKPVSICSISQCWRPFPQELMVNPGCLEKVLLLEINCLVSGCPLGCYKVWHVTQWFCWSVFVLPAPFVQNRLERFMSLLEIQQSSFLQRWNQEFLS